jgi:hypothetical protein
LTPNIAPSETNTPTATTVDRLVASVQKALDSLQGYSSNTSVSDVRVLS